MTGEVTLRGNVLAVGGIKDKVLAAYRAGIRDIVLPHKNGKDLIELPDEVKKNVKFTLAEHVDELLQLALVGYDPLKTKIAPDSTDLGDAAQADEVEVS